jgi:hypothetical protein
MNGQVIVSEEEATVIGEGTKCGLPSSPEDGSSIVIILRCMSLEENLYFTQIL